MIKKLSVSVVAVAFSLFDNGCIAMQSGCIAMQPDGLVIGVECLSLHSNIVRKYAISKCREIVSLNGEIVRLNENVVRLNKEKKLLQGDVYACLLDRADNDFDKKLINCIFTLKESKIEQKDVIELFFSSLYYMTTVASASSMNGIKVKNTTLYSLVEPISAALNLGVLSGATAESRSKLLADFIIEMGILGVDKGKLVSRNCVSDRVLSFLCVLNGMRHPNDDGALIKKGQRNYFQVPRNVSYVLAYILLMTHCNFDIESIPVEFHGKGKGKPIEIGSYSAVTKAKDSEVSNSCTASLEKSEDKVREISSQKIMQSVFTSEKKTAYRAFIMDENGINALRRLAMMFNQ